MTDIKTVSKLLSNSYKGDKIADSIEGNTLDKDLSGQRVQVYKNDITGKAYVVHRGTQDIQDVFTDARLFLGDKSSERFKHSKRIQQEAMKKYGANNVTTLGHSLGGTIGEKVGRKSENIITLNKPVNITDAFSIRVPKNQIDYKTQNDPTSVLRGFQKGKKPTVIKSTTKNPLTEHRVNVINRLVKF